MSELTKLQRQVVEAIFDGVRIRSSLSGWIVMPERKVIRTAVVSNLINGGYLVSAKSGLHYWLRLTEAGQQLARERFEQQ